MADNTAEIRAKVEAAVDAALLQGKVTRSTIIADFADSGVGQATLYRWINARMRVVAADVVMQGRPIVTKVEALAVRGDTAPRPAGIDFHQRLLSSLERTDVLRAMAYTADGKPKNVKLARDTDEDERRKLHTAASIQEKLEASAMHKMYAAFIDEILSIVMAELPESRDRILSRMEEVRARYGAGFS
jgi:hypothetical protein